MHHNDPTSKPALRIVSGTKNKLEAARKRLLERAKIVAYQWGNGEIGPRGQLRLVEAFRERMPGIGENLISVCGPAILQAIVERGEEGELDEETVAVLAHILDPPNRSAREAEATVDGEVQRIRQELAIISEGWDLRVNPDGHFIDITGSPRMPTGVMEGEAGELRAEYNQVNVATIYTEAPQTEQITNARFIAMAPRRIEWLIGIIERLMAAGAK